MRKFRPQTLIDALQPFPAGRRHKRIGVALAQSLATVVFEALLEQERGELSDLDRQVIESHQSGQLVSQNRSDAIEDSTSFGKRMADHVAAFGGSWPFIISFTAILVIWITGNAIGIMVRPFDPYPFILLNLVLSSLAALQPRSSC